MFLKNNVVVAVVAPATTPPVKQAEPQWEGARFTALVAPLNPALIPRRREEFYHAIGEIRA